MIVFREEFIKRYFNRLCHKVEQEFIDKLPEKGFFAEMITEANKIVHNITKED